MEKTLPLEDKIRSRIHSWLEQQGDSFVICIKEFCQGNRASLTSLRTFLKELGAKVFAADGKKLDDGLLEDLEYGIFNLIGRFTSTPGGPELLKAIQKNIDSELTKIFAEVKRRWNFNNYKVAESFEELDPGNCVIPAIFKSAGDEYCGQEYSRENTQHQARIILDELVLFAKREFRGEKKRKIAINWLENPEKRKDFCWFASLIDSSTGSVKVTLTRIRQSFAKKFEIKHKGKKLILIRSQSP
ncbi:MAG: hypothetical protein B6D58_00890 [candidate division Zixibacteria bacterium 4484_95]|nr:MAG: hypothetical protein B6D58_00890 [candidate division Zixibacteria bacterium 4484_95]